MTADPVQESERKPLAARLALNPDGILEQIAREYGVSTLEVVRNLLPDQRTITGGEHFAEILADVTAWGEIVFIVHTPDIVLECKGVLPPGGFARGYFNLHGDSPIGGHIRAENCRAIVFVSRPFMGRASCSIQFFNEAGEAMFKIFVSRNEARELIPEQLQKFEALRARIREAAGGGR
jgi:putative heme utilization carrier protein HutX